MSWHHQIPKHNEKYILPNDLGSKYILVMKFDQFMKHYKEKFLSKNYVRNMAWKLFPGLFQFSKNPL